MDFLYNLAVSISAFFLKLLTPFLPKLNRFFKGRKQLFEKLEEQIAKEDRVIWVHAASLGEFEQGLPIIQRLREEYPGFKLLLTFFSPSGYEVRKNSGAADVICYLPLDTKKNARRFLEIARPSLAVFIKYEIWPNYFEALRKGGTPIVLISAIFRKRQVFFKWYGGYMRKALRKVSFIFVQDQQSQILLDHIGFSNTAVSGDTRFDRVSQILDRDNTLPMVEEFKGNSLCLVAGSTWPEDETLLLDLIDKTPEGMKFILAPHDIKADHIAKLRSRISGKTLVFSEREGKVATDYDVLLVDTIGLLTRIYSYADLAYVGGGFATGLHNTLEPAVFGIPVLIGPQYEGFKEAEDLVAQKGILVVKDKTTLSDTVNQLIQDADYYRTTGRINAEYITKNKGASVQIMGYLRTLL
ncbi:3-deoxy-D-manno-octulosonic acid transferase [Poritiphilus flavus]|uniref:3-deoxy-D-manno-octulosonic acid transferase n=1 Tax=Poritiphilus flavus TaxID=2697053 RepID=A0A6L9E6P1_9FLAO|nr:glycosyltransferase N-terminal domain-containing protein [Poritiphilus flavus]NAS10415.1 3-deoxy-D-manno-octulosonic acid transferase [Poritiphilus flavus]